MKIAKVDAHHHLWTLGSPHYPVLQAPDMERYFGNTAGLKIDFGPDELKRVGEPQNVVKSVYVESHFEPPVAESAYVQALADRHGFPNAIVGRVDMVAPDICAVLDAHMKAAPLFRGVRTIVSWDEDPQFRSAPQDIMATPDWVRGYVELGRRGLIAEVMALPSQLTDLARVAAENPDTVLVVNHTGMPLRRTPAEDAAWREGLAALARLPQVSIKISGLGMVDRAWTVESIRPLVDAAIELFGPDRCMFASNFPVDGLQGSYDRIWDAFDQITANRPDADRAALFHDTAVRLYRIA